MGCIHWVVEPRGDRAIKSCLGLFPFFWSRSYGHNSFISSLYMTTVARRQECPSRREPWRIRGRSCHIPNTARGMAREARKREGSDLRTNPFQEGEDDTTMEAVHQSLYLQLSSISIMPVKMTSKCFETATIIFVFERASRGYLTCPNRSSEERVMDDLLKPRRTGRELQKEHPGGCFHHENHPTGWKCCEAFPDSRRNTRAGVLDRTIHPRLSFCGPFSHFGLLV